MTVIEEEPSLSSCSGSGGSSSEESVQVPKPPRNFNRCTDITIVSEGARTDAEAVIGMFIDLPPFFEFFDSFKKKKKSKTFPLYFNELFNAVERVRLSCRRLLLKM